MLAAAKNNAVRVAGLSHAKMMCWKNQNNKLKGTVQHGTTERNSSVELSVK